MKIGEIAKGCEVGVGKTSHKAMWCACADCGVERWVLLRKGKPQSERCHPCGAKHAAAKRRGTRMGPRASNWRGGRQVLRNGYVMVTLSPDDPYAAMGSAKRHRAVYEHRYVMAKHLGRLLEPWEEVHHKNHDKQDNRIENLEVHSKADHAFGHAQARLYIQRIAELEAEIQELRARITECEARCEQAQTP